MGRRSNYGYEKQQREIRKQKKKEAKAERRRLRKLGEEEAEIPGAEELGSLEELVDDEAPESLRPSGIGEPGAGPEESGG